MVSCVMYMDMRDTYKNTVTKSPYVGLTFYVAMGIVAIQGYPVLVPGTTYRSVIAEGRNITALVSLSHLSLLVASHKLS